MKTYGKAILSFLFFLWTVIAPLLTGDGRINGFAEWAVIGVGAANGLIVYIIPLNPRWAYGKTVANGILASLAAAQTLYLDGWQPEDLTIIIGAFLAIVIGWYMPSISLPKSTQPVVVPKGLNA